MSLLDRRMLMFNHIGASTSPYSNAATAALQAQFSTEQWMTIRNYGLAHPEIVGYMNAYAPEDAKIAYSLVEGIGTRWIAAQDTRSYFNPGYSNLNLSAYVRSKVKLLSVNSGTTALWGVWDTNQFRTFYYRSWGGIVLQYGSTYKTKSMTPDANHLYIVEVGDGKYKVDGETVWNYTASTAAVNKTFLVGLSMASDAEWPNTNDQIGIAEFYIELGNFKSWLIPFNNHGTAELLDLITGQFVPKVGSGSFTISETQSA